MAQQEIETARLLLRRWTEADHAPFAEICADPEVMRYIGDGTPRSPENAARDIASFEREWEEKSFGLFAVEEKSSGTLIGFTGLSSPDFLPEILPAVEIGWRFAQWSWEQGYASEAAGAALSFGVDRLGLSEIVSICQPGNRASVRIMRKLGMVFDRHAVTRNSRREVEVYRLPRTEG